MSLSHAFLTSKMREMVPESRDGSRTAWCRSRPGIPTSSPPPRAEGPTASSDNAKARGLLRVQPHVGVAPCGGGLRGKPSVARRETLPKAETPGSQGCGVQTWAGKRASG